MIHHLLFSDTFFVDTLFPFYLLIDTLFGFGFYQPYTNEIHYTSDLLLKIYGYAFSSLFLYKIFSMFKWEPNKRVFFDNITLVLIFTGIVELLLIWFCSAGASTSLIMNFFESNNLFLFLLMYFLSTLLFTPVIAFFGVAGFLLIKKLEILKEK